MCSAAVSACPLRRLQDTVDAMRLLCDPQRQERKGHRYRLIVSHPATDSYCGTGLGGGASVPPKVVVAEAPPKFANWTDHSSFPHG